MRGLAILLGFLFAGELAAHMFRLPLPGSALGMAFLLGWLWRIGQVPEELGNSVGALLSNMPLLFVPVGVGAMAYAGLFQSQWLLIALAVVGCTLLTIAATVAVTGWACSLMAARQARHQAKLSAMEASVSERSMVERPSQPNQPTNPMTRQVEQSTHTL